MAYLRSLNPAELRRSEIPPPLPPHHSLQKLVSTVEDVSPPMRDQASKGVKGRSKSSFLASLNSTLSPKSFGRRCFSEGQATNSTWYTEELRNSALFAVSPITEQSEGSDLADNAVEKPTTDPLAPAAENDASVPEGGPRVNSGTRVRLAERRTNRLQDPLKRRSSCDLTHEQPTHKQTGEHTYRPVSQHYYSQLPELANALVTTKREALSRSY